MRIAIYLLLVLPAFLFGQEYYPDAEVYVHAYSGLILRSGPSVDETKIMSLPYGGKLKVVERAAAYTGMTDFEGYRWKDYWYKVDYQGNVGYVFGGYISRFPPVKLGQPSIWAYVEANFRVRDTLVLKPVWVDRRPCSYMVVYEEGVVFTSYTCGATCADERFIWEETTLAEVAAIMQAIFIQAEIDVQMNYKPEMSTLFFHDEGCTFTLKALPSKGVVLHISCCT